MFNNVRRISGQLFAYGTADVMALVVNFFLLPLYTRVLSPREYGALALLLVCEAVLKVINRWGLDGAFLRFYYEQDDERRRTLAGTIAIFLVMVNGAIAVLLLATAVPINRLMFSSQEFTGAYRLLILNGFASTFLFLPLNLLRAQERSKLFAALTFVRSFGTVVMRIVLVLWLHTGVFGLMLADVVVTAALLAALARTMTGMLAWRFSRDLLRELLNYGFPQVPNGLLIQTMGMGDRFVLGLFMPLQAVGLYLIGSTVASVIKFYPVAFEAAWTPFAYDSLARRDAPLLFGRLATYAYAVLTFFTIALTGLAPPLMVLVLPFSYRTVAPLVPLLALGMAVQSLRSLPATSLNIAKQTRIYPMLTAAGAVANIAANLLLIPRFGMYGAGVALMASQALATGLTAYFGQRAYPIAYELGRLLKLSFVGGVTYLAMTMAAPAMTWSSVSIRAALIAIFPLGLLLLRFFRPHELAEFRSALSLLDKRIIHPARSL